MQGKVLESLPTPSQGIIFPFPHQRKQQPNVDWKNLSGHPRTNFCIKSLVYFYNMQIRGTDGKFNNVVILVMPQVQDDIYLGKIILVVLGMMAVAFESILILLQKEVRPYFCKSSRVKQNLSSQRKIGFHNDCIVCLGLQLQPSCHGHTSEKLSVAACLKQGCGGEERGHPPLSRGKPKASRGSQGKIKRPGIVPSLAFSSSLN